MSESYSTVTLVAIGIAAGFLLSLLVSSVGLIWAILAVIAVVGVYGLTATRGTGQKQSPSHSRTSAAPAEHIGSDEHITPLSKEEARRWLDNFLVEQQIEKKQ